MSRSWQTGGGRIASRAVKPRGGVVTSRLEAPLRAVPRRRASRWIRFRLWLQFMASYIAEWRIRRRFRRGA